MVRMAVLPPPCYGTPGHATRARTSCRRRRTDSHDQAPAWRLARHAYLDVLANLQGLLQVGGLWLLLSWALLMLGRSSALFGRRCRPRRWPSAPPRSRSPGTATCSRTSRSPPGWRRSMPARRSATSCSPVMLAFLVGVLPLLVLFVTAGGTGRGRRESRARPRPASGARADDRLHLRRDAPAADLSGDRDRRPRPERRPLLGGHRRQWLAAGARLLPGYPARGGRLLGVAFLLAWAADATGSIALAALADLAAVANAWLQAPLIASFLSFAYLFFRQQGQTPLTAQ